MKSTQDKKPPTNSTISNHNNYNYFASFDHINTSSQNITNQKNHDKLLGNKCQKEAILNVEQLNKKIQVVILKVLRHVRHLYDKHQCNLEYEQIDCKMIQERKAYNLMSAILKHDTPSKQKDTSVQRTNKYNYSPQLTQQLVGENHFKEKQVAQPSFGIENTVNPQAQSQFIPPRLLKEDNLVGQRIGQRTQHRQNSQAKYLWQMGQDNQQNKVQAHRQNLQKVGSLQSKINESQNFETIVRLRKQFNQYGLCYRPTVDQEKKVFEAVSLFYAKKKKLTVNIVSQIARQIINSPYFKGSRGWVNKFCSRYPSIRYILRQGKFVPKVQEGNDMNEQRKQTEHSLMSSYIRKQQRNQDFPISTIVINDSEDQMNNQLPHPQTNKDNEGEKQQNADNELDCDKLKLNNGINEDSYPTHVRKSVNNLICLAELDGLDSTGPKIDRISIQQNQDKDISRFKFIQQKLMSLPQFMDQEIQPQSHKNMPSFNLKQQILPQKKKLYRVNDSSQESI